MKQWNLCIIINLLFYTAIIQYMSQLLETQHFTAKMTPFWRYWHLCNENSAYATIASCAPSTRQGAIKLCRGSNNGTGSSLKITSHGNKEISYVSWQKYYFETAEKSFIPFNCCTLRWYCISPATLGLNHHASKLEKGCKLCCGAVDTETCPLPHLWFSGSWHQTMDWSAVG